MAEKLQTNIRAPEFELVDTRGQTVHLSDYLGNEPVVLVLLRGFL